MPDISNNNDVIDVRDIIARIEELEDSEDPYETEELATLSGFMEELAGSGGDEQWRGDWYPVTLVRDSYFLDYAQELADELGMTPGGLTWPMTCIDWDQAAKELRMDYTSAEFDGITYWYR